MMAVPLRSCCCLSSDDVPVQSPARLAVVEGLTKAAVWVTSEKAAKPAVQPRSGIIFVAAEQKKVSVVVTEMQPGQAEVRV